MRSRRKLLGRRARIVIDTMLPSGVDPVLPLGAFDADFDGFYDEFSRVAPRPMRLAFGAALFAGTWIAPLLIGRVPPLSRHARADRERALESLARSRLSIARQLMTVLKAVICLAYGGDARVKQALGQR